MSYQATVFPVMIASPGDVTEERDIAREVLHEWNDIHAAHRSMVFLPIGWDSNSSPELGARPQSQINNRILNECDLLIGIFWTRLGSPTGEFESGTVEEIERHVAAGKPAMLYFSECQIKPKNLDSVQYDRLNEFRSTCMPRGIVESYTDINEFRRKLTRQIQHCLHDNEYLKEISKQQEPNAAFAPASEASEEASASTDDDGYDDADREVILKSWLDNSLSAISGNALKYADIDKELSLNNGSTKNILPAIINKTDGYSLTNMGSKVFTFSCDSPLDSYIV